MTARLPGDLNVDVLVVVEAESRAALVEFNSDLLNDRYWTIYPEITKSVHAASDHAAVWVTVNL